MDFNKFERKFRKFSISNITLYVSLGMVIVYFLALAKPEIIDILYLNPDKIFDGQIWRLVTFIFIPTSSNPISLFFEVAIFYWVGSALENVWGSFKFTLYYLGGIIGATLGVILGHFIGGLAYQFSFSVSSFFTMNLFLAFAWYFGDEEIRVMLILPVKVKYLAIIDAVFILYTLISAPTWGARLVLISSMLNLVVFYSVVLSRRLKDKGRMTKFKMKMNLAQAPYKKKSRHKCVVCGKTEITHPDMQFRYCSKCEGDYEFCEEHINNHDHFKKIVEFRKSGEE